MEGQSPFEDESNVDPIDKTTAQPIVRNNATKTTTKPTSEIVSATSSTIADLPSTEVQSLMLHKSSLQPVENSEVFRWRSDGTPIKTNRQNLRDDKVDEILSPSVIKDLPSTSSVVSLHLEQKDLKPIENSEAFMFIRPKPQTPPVATVPQVIGQPMLSRQPVKPPSTPPQPQTVVVRTEFPSPMPQCLSVGKSPFVAFPLSPSEPPKTNDSHNTTSVAPLNSLVLIKTEPINAVPIPKIRQTLKTTNKPLVQQQKSLEKVQRQELLPLHTYRTETEECLANKEIAVDPILLRETNKLILVNITPKEIDSKQFDPGKFSPISPKPQTQTSNESKTVSMPQSIKPKSVPPLSIKGKTKPLSSGNAKLSKGTRTKITGASGKINKPHKITAPSNRSQASKAPSTKAPASTKNRIAIKNAGKQPKTTQVKRTSKSTSGKTSINLVKTTTVKQQSQPRKGIGNEKVNTFTSKMFPPPPSE